MTEKCLEVTFTLKSDEATLQQLEASFQSTFGQTVLTSRLEAWLKTQVAGEFEVELLAEHLIVPQEGLGLNATEWLESQKFSRRPNGQPVVDYSAVLD